MNSLLLHISMRVSPPPDPPTGHRGSNRTRANMTSRQQILTASGVLAAALALSATVAAYGGPHVVGAVVGMALRHHVLLVVARNPFLLRAAL